MINIVPEQQKEVLKKEYEYRRAVVFCGLVIFILMVSLILLIPSYFLTNIRAKEVSVELEKSKQALNEELPPEDVMKELAVAVHHANDLKPFTKPVSVYDLMRIFESKPAAITITQIAFTDRTSGQPQISLSGRAQDRESLTAFGRALESRVEFARVDLPVSNFAKESNIDFSMNITTK